VSLAAAWYFMAGVLRRFGRLDDAGGAPVGGVIPANNRDTLVYGQYKADETNTGVIPGTVLSNYNSTSANTVTIPAGAVIISKRIYGDATFLGSATVLNCVIYGGAQVITSGNTAVLNFNNTRAGIVTVKDSVIAPRTQSNGRDCVLGKQFELERCHIYGGIDGVGIYTTSTSDFSVKVKVRGCLIEDLTYVFPDLITPTHLDGTHNDPIQIQGGRDILIKGNTLRGTSHALAGTGTNPQKPWLIGLGYCNGSCVIVQNNTGAGIDHTVIIEDNYTSGALTHYNIKPGIVFTMNNNHLYRETAVATGWSGYWARFDDHTTTVTGLNSGTLTNRWIDGPHAGELLAEPRDSGIHYNA
jgi:hypothetical protein